jgi:hypothetical protein
MATTHPFVVDAGPPFNSPTADVIIRSSDSVDFRTSQGALSYVSPYFEKLFEGDAVDDAVDPSDSLKDGILVVPIQVDSDTLRAILLRCIPGRAPELTMEGTRKALDVAMKYDMPLVTKALLTRQPQLLSIDPSLAIVAFCVGCHYDWDKVVELGARSSLSFAITDFPREETMKWCTMLQYHELLDFRRRCVDAVTPLCDDISWWRDSDCNHTKICHRSRESHNDYIRTYFSRAKDALRDRPAGFVVQAHTLLDDLIKEVHKHEVNASSAFKIGKSLSDALAAMVNKTTSEVSSWFSIQGPTFSDIV